MTHKVSFHNTLTSFRGVGLAHRVALGLLALDFNFEKELTI